ncbi:MAG TPA: glycoside hydrolase family 43 protein [Opitutaceae bacterium]|nr:glycoside hydrolase family 43 protein [Opitutaceae bacterium]
MRTFLLFAACCCCAAAAAPAPALFGRFEYTGMDPRFSAPLEPGEYRNPVLAGFHPDPSLCRVGRDYYLANSSFCYFPGIPIFHSRDLAHWDLVGHVITRRTQVDFQGLGISRGVFAPDLSYRDGVYYLTTTLADCGGNCVFTARDPAGPWSDPHWLRGVDGIDPSLFFEGGRIWLVNNGPPPENRPLYDGHRAIWLRELDPATLQPFGPVSLLVNGGTDLARKPVWIEGPHLFKREGWYYLICAEGGTAEQHSEVVFRSRALEGPWAAGPANPILTQRDLPPGRPEPVSCTGHAEFADTPAGDTWAVFLGCRPYEANLYNTGRETFLLPVSWSGGWPRILPPGEAVPAAAPAPRLPRFAARAPTTGNFTWRDDFTEAALDPSWNFLRTPRETWWSLPSPGTLALRPRQAGLDSLANPSFVGRRLEHARFAASAELRLPLDPGVAAGIAAFQNEGHYFFLGVRRRGAGAEVFLERADGAKAAEVAQAALPPGGRAALRIEGRGRAYAFAYGSGAGDWKILGGEQDGSILSTARAGGFVGSYVGLFARLGP